VPAQIVFAAHDAATARSDTEPATFHSEIHGWCPGALPLAGWNTDADGSREIVHADAGSIRTRKSDRATTTTTRMSSIMRDPRRARYRENGVW
jgi:hypothetical protein